MSRAARLAAWLTIVPAIAVAAPARGQDGDVAPNDSAGYTPGPAATAGLELGGYLDVGFVNAHGNGTSFAPGDTRVPADYGVDTFAPAVNSRGDVASTDAGGRFVNGFLPHSAGTGGRSSVLINTLSFDARYEAGAAPVMLFSRLQLVPRFGPEGDRTRTVVDQAYARVIPLDAHELMLFVGKFDPVFGIEYLESQAPLRTGVTPSLIARYTTGSVTGAKAFYRLHLPRLWSAFSVNAAATDNPPMVDSLQTAAVSLSGFPVLSARAGYELNLPALQVKLGGSLLRGPRNDQSDPKVRQSALGADVRVAFLGVSIAGEYIDLWQGRGSGEDKTTPLGLGTIPSAFWAQGFYLFASYTLPWRWDVLSRATFYARYGRRHAWFEGYQAITVDRITGGARLDLWDTLALKAEYLANGEIAGAPTVSNDVLAFSLIAVF